MRLQFLPPCLVHRLYCRRLKKGAILDSPEATGVIVLRQFILLLEPLTSAPTLNSKKWSSLRLPFFIKVEMDMVKVISPCLILSLSRLMRLSYFL